MAVCARVLEEGEREQVRLADGTWVQLRCIGPSDAALVQDVFSRMSEPSRLNRFHHTKRALTPAEVHYFTHVDGYHHYALGAVALAGPGGRAGDALGVARFIRLHHQPAVGEAAFAVVDAAQGKGLGRLLLERLVAAARKRQVERFECNVLAANQPMRRLLAPLRPEVTVGPDGTVRLEVALRPGALPAGGARQAHAHRGICASRAPGASGSPLLPCAGLYSGRP